MYHKTHVLNMSTRWQQTYIICSHGPAVAMANFWKLSCFNQLKVRYHDTELECTYRKLFSKGMTYCFYDWLVYPYGSLTRKVVDLRKKLWVLLFNIFLRITANGSELQNLICSGQLLTKQNYLDRITMRQVHHYS